MQKIASAQKLVAYFYPLDKFEKKKFVFVEPVEGLVFNELHVYYNISSIYVC